MVYNCLPLGRAGFTHLRRRAFVLSAAAALGPAAWCPADTWTRGAGVNNNWSLGTNWADGTEPVAADPVIFPVGIPAGQAIINMTGTELAASLTINNNYTFNGGGTANLTIASGGFISVAGGSTALLATILTANANALTINGAGTLAMDKTSSRTGTTLIQNGVVRFQNTNPLGSGTITINNNGFLEIPNPTGNSTPVSLGTNGGLRGGGGGSGFYSGTATVAASTSVKLNGGPTAADSLRLGNFVANRYTGGSGTTTVVTGPGTVFFTADNDYAGHWQVDSGTLEVFTTMGLGTATSAVVVNNGGTLQPSNITFSRDVTLNHGATLAGEAPDTTGVVTVSPGAGVTFLLESSFSATFELGDSSDDLTGGGSGSSIAVTTTNPGNVLRMNESSNYTGNWTIGNNAIVQIDANENLGDLANTVTMNGGTLRTTGDFTTGRTFAVTASTFDVIFGSTLTMLAGMGSGSGTTTKAGDGTLVLVANSSRSGTIDIVNGTVVAQGGNALGTSTVIVQGSPATLELDNTIIGNTLIMANTATLRGRGTAGAAASMMINTSANVNIATANPTDTLTLSGPISGTGGAMTFAGPGTVVITGPVSNSYSGLTTVTGGTLRLNKSVGNAIPSNLSVEGIGVAILDTSEQIANANVNVFGGGQFNLNGFTETVATVTMSAGTITGGGGTLILNGGLASGISTFNSAATAQINANINLNAADRVFNIQNGSANPDVAVNGVISNGSLTKTNAGSMLMSGSSANTYTGTTTINAGILSLQKSSSGVAALAGDVSLGAQGVATLRILQSEQIANTASITLAASSGPVSAGIVELFTFTETINNLTMTAGQITGTGGTLILNGNVTTNPVGTTATIQPHVNLGGGTRTFSIADGAAASDMTISGSVSNGTLIKTGNGKLAVNGIRAAGLSVNAGKVEVLFSGNTNANTSRLASLTVAVGATLDLTDNDLIVDGGNYGAIEADVISGYNNGNWGGDGVTSSAAAANASLYALGVADNDDLNNTEFSGQTGLDGDEILVKQTYVGDANLTGGVNLDDFNQFLFGFNPANAAPQIWLNGDFNYTGAVNLDDFNLFLFGLSNQGGTLVSPELFTALSEFVIDEGVDVDLSSVPEPTMLWTGVGMALLLRRRRLARSA